jgi:predicted PurR-regulated permease PerM
MRKTGQRNHGNRNSESWTPILLLIAALVILYLLWNTLLIFILAAFLAFVLNPLVELLPERVPRPIRIGTVYLTIGIVLGLIISLLIPVVVQQYQQLSDSMPTYASQARGEIQRLQTSYVHLSPTWRTIGDRALSELQQIGVYLTHQLLPAAFAFFTSLLALVLIPLIAFFMLLGGDGYRRTLMAILPRRHRDTISDLLHCANRSLWNFVRGESILMLTVGTMTGVGLYVVGMPYSAIFGVLAGFLELIPNFGPLTSTMAVGITGLLIDPVLALKGIAVTTSVQLSENAFLVPLVMGKTVGLNAVTVAFALLMGGRTAGVVGAIIAIPIAVLVKTVILYFYARPEDLPQGQAAICRPQTRDGHGRRSTARTSGSSDRGQSRAA